MDFFRNKTSRPSFDWRDVWAEEHAHAFTVAKATRVEVLETIRRALDDALAKGIPFEQFRKELTPRLQKLGWWGRHRVVDPATGQDVLAQLGSPRRLQVIYDANVRTAHAAGQWFRAQRTKQVLPFFLYVQTTSVTPREDHLAQVGTIAPIDDPYWDVWFPPNGWQCKCQVRQITAAEATKRGWNPKKKPREMPTRSWLNKRTGEIEEIPAGIDPGWQTNPAKRRHAMLDELLSGALENVDPALRAAALKDLPSSWMFSRVVSGQFADMSAVAAPVGHLGASVRTAQGLKSGVVWVGGGKPAAATVKAADWVFVPRIIDEGAIVRHRYKKGAISVFRNIDGQYWRVDVEPGSAADDARMMVTAFRPVSKTQAKTVVEAAARESRLVRAEAPVSRDLFKLPPAWTSTTTPIVKPAASAPPIDQIALPLEGRGDEAPRSQAMAFRQAADTVLLGGRATNAEWGYAYDAKTGGHLLTWTAGQRRHLPVTEQIIPELFDPKRKIVVHHNHPGSTSFSDEDLVAFRLFPGLSKLVVVGHDGSIYRVHKVSRSRIADAVDAVSIQARSRLRKSVGQGDLTENEARLLLQHVKVRVLNDAGLVKYSATFGPETAALVARKSAILEALVAELTHAYRQTRSPRR